MKTNQDNETFDLLPANKSSLLDADAKVGQIYFTKDQKIALLKLVESPVWELLKLAYAKQRYAQIGFATVNVAQTAEDLFFYKGKAAESSYFVKEIERIVSEYRKDIEEKKS